METLLERILVILLFGAILFEFNDEEKKIRELDKRITKLEIYVASNNSYWK